MAAYLKLRFGDNVLLPFHPILYYTVFVSSDDECEDKSLDYLNLEGCEIGWGVCMENNLESLEMFWMEISENVERSYALSECSCCFLLYTTYTFFKINSM